jgi:sugar lactone lactonase YvrE
VDELIRRKMHEALEVEQPAADLRSRVLSALPADEPRVTRGWTLSGQWAAGFVAVLLAIAVVAGLLYTRGALGPITPGRGLHRVSPPRLISPEGIVVGPDGTVYVSDYVGGYVFRFASDGSRVIAGTGKGGDGGPALTSSLKTPTGIALDRDGNLFVAEQCPQRIRRIDRSGIITTVAGNGQAGCGAASPSANNFSGDSGPATSAGLTNPLGLAFDSSGALYVGDAGSAHVRRIDPSGTITSLDTSSLAFGISFPGYLAFDAAGNLYVSDGSGLPGTGSCRILRFSPAGNVSVVAGTGTCGFGGDGGPAIAAKINDPNGIAFDSSGNLYLADSNNHRIRRIDRNGVISTVAGTGVAGLGGDRGPGTGAQLQWPFGLAMASGDLLYIADDSCGCSTPTTAGRIRILRLSDDTITTAAG